MARTTPSPSPRPGRRSIIPPALTLAGWRLGQTWRLLLTAGLGILAAVVLVASVPLFSQVAVSAGLRGALADNPAGAGIGVTVHTFTVSPALRQQVQDRLFSVMQRDLGAYLAGSPTFAVQTPYLPLGTVAHREANRSDTLGLVGVNLDAASSHLTVTTGRLPAPQGATLEVALEAASAQLLQVRVGDTIAYPAVASTTGKAITARIVGIFVVRDRADPFWSGADFVARQTGGPNGSGTAYTALGAVNTVMAIAGQLLGSDAVNQYSAAALRWHYDLDFSHLSGGNLGDLIAAFNAINIEANNSLDTITGVQFVEFNSGIEQLIHFQDRIFSLQVPITLLLLQVLALVIFFVSLMADMVVERQTEAIAVLRSRGASRRQIFGALATQTGGLALLAAIAGPPLAILGVRLVAAHTLAASDQGALNVLAGDPLAVIWGIRYFVLAAVVGAALAMLISINRAMGLDVLALRRESARTTRLPVWQRLNLDVIFGFIGVTGYISYIVALGRLSPRLQSLLSPLSLVAPFFLLIAAALLFLRFFPLALNGAAWLAGRGRRAEPMLALAQMARAPRQSLRTTLLLALTTAFTIFTLVFVASQNQHTLDAAAFTVGADLTGTLPSATAATSTTVAAQEAQYAALPGVTSATVGYNATVSAQTTTAQIQVTFDAVNADSFAQTAVWPSSNSTQSIGELMGRLRDNRALATEQDVVPTIVDEALWQSFHLGQDPHFTLSVPGYNAASLHLIAVGHIAHISGIFDVPGYFDNSGALVDLASYAAVYQHDTSTALQQNQIWLRTSDDTTKLAALRATLNDAKNPLHLTQIFDRRNIITTAGRDPLVLDLLGVLAICTVTAGLLGVLGALVAAWLSARSRLTNFAVLRALGSDPGQTARVLVWEQAIITVTALGLGLSLGLVLAGAILPTLIFTNIFARQDTFLGASNVPPIQTVIPFGAVGAVVGGVALIFIILLALMTRIVARPSIGQTLRLNED